MQFSGGVNRIFLVGEVAGDVQQKIVDDVEVLCFFLATTEVFQKNGRRSEHVEMHDVKLPLNVKKNTDINRGDLLFIQGKLKTHQVIEDNHSKNYKAEIWVIQIERLKSAQFDAAYRSL
jgi:single-stranded DNA-binding protein